MSLGLLSNRQVAFHIFTIELYVLSRMIFMFPPRILSLGYDDVLMTVRTILLRQAGYDVFEIWSVDEAIKQIRLGRYDLVVMCHTVPADQRDTLIAAIHSLALNTPFLCLSSTPEYSHLEQCPPACSTAPEFLVDVSHALRKHPN
jgi:hypothetical protein